MSNLFFIKLFVGSFQLLRKSIFKDVSKFCIYIHPSSKFRLSGSIIAIILSSLKWKHTIPLFSSNIYKDIRIKKWESHNQDERKLN